MMGEKSDCPVEPNRNVNWTAWFHYECPELTLKLTIEAHIRYVQYEFRHEMTLTPESSLLLSRL
jgi:hypothetical protein